MIKGAIFDLDGTLADSNPYWDKAPGEWLLSVGKQAKPGLAREIFAMTLPEAAEYIRKEYGLTHEDSEMISGINAVMERFYLNDVPLKLGVAELIEMLEGRGIKCSVASVTDKYLVEGVLARFGMLDRLSAVLSVDDVGVGKNEPDIFLRAAQSMGSLPSETIVFEDALHALKTAKKAGFFTAGVYDEASNDLQDEIRAVSDVYMEDFSDLSALVDILR